MDDQLGRWFKPVQTVTGPAVTTVSHVYAAELTAQTISVIATDASGTTGSAVTTTVQILVWQIQADPLQPGSQILVVGGSASGDDIRLTRHGSGQKGYYSYRMDQIDDDERGDENDDHDQDDDQDDDDHESTVRIDSSISGVIVYAQGGNDRIDLQNRIDIWSILDGGSGNDKITGGGAANIILSATATTGYPVKRAATC